ncbi:cation chloride cotransporter [Blastomyces gilchristii SLH14081]|uniref:Cation chloride cotransporter n=1 Tax=Blastomyces gilchristii (strain SLH14081) TaxID=559298 RepID=A0A179UE86_BLAGS|nr:cation chloride cotransporter [Blastomyces gilchristii SLH14081]OAT05457.1 cation chloride cotransporter [Blastomyces gilchristii SLH14081]
MAESWDAGHGGPRKRPTFAARSADAAGTGFDTETRSSDNGNGTQYAAPARPYEPLMSTSPPPAGGRAFTSSIFGSWGKRKSQDVGREADVEQQRTPGVVLVRRASVALQDPRNIDFLDKKEKVDQRSGAPDGSGKLGSFSGVFVPTTLNVLSILMFLRFGFILGQAGVLGTLGMLAASYLINLLTTMSISAIATNGTVRGGGAYYLISRSLGPEFGGSIGIVFYIGFVLNTGMNAVGLINCLIQSFGSVSGKWSQIMLEGFWWTYLWATIVLVLCTVICLAGSSIFSRASNGLLVILLVATFSIPVSALMMEPFKNKALGIEFTGPSSKTFVDNLLPRLTKGAAGSQIRGRQTFQDLFGILFPATGGIFAGASMSGDLKHPSKSIPKGTLCGLGVTLFTYTVVILSMACSITRTSLYNDVNIIQDTNASGILILLGEFATSFFSSLMGVIGSAKLLQAIARDTLIPGLTVFSQGTAKQDEPTNAIIFTFVVAQIAMLFDINQIASFITMTYLMTFLVTNLACFLLKVGSAPNFRPSFHYFNSWTALFGTIISGVTMFFVDGVYASGCVCILMLLFLLIHYTTPPKSWGDVSQNLIYHQVRKYLLRLRPEHVKFWRPQILLFVNDFDSQYKMIHFCNSLKKGGLFVLGHVIVADDFASAVPDARREQASWTRFIEFSKVKAFINISVAPTAEWGIRNIALTSGLGGMRPNIVIIDEFRKNQLVAETPFASRLRRRSSISKPTDPLNGNETLGASISGTESCKADYKMSVQSYLTVLEDLLFKLRINVAIAKGFDKLELPASNGGNTKKYIDLWPIQMSAEIATDGTSKQNLLTTNFDTYTLILQLGCILNTVPSWKKSYRLRVAVFVEYESDVEEERRRVATLLEKLRIEAKVLVFWLASGDFKSYQIIVNGDESGLDQATIDAVDRALKDEDWWQDVRRVRAENVSPQKGASTLLGTAPKWPASSFQHGRHRGNSSRLDSLRKLIENSKRRRSIGSFGAMGFTLGMQTQRLLDTMVDYHSDNSSESSSDDSDFEPYFSDGDHGANDDSSSKQPSQSNTEEAGTAAKSPSDDLRQRIRAGLHKSKRHKMTHVLPRASTETAVEDEPSSPSGSEATPLRRHIPTITTTDDDGLQGSAFTGRPDVPRSVSSNKFSSSPIPTTRVADKEDSGPSIMFASSPPRDDLSSGPSGPRESIYARQPTPDAAASSRSNSPSRSSPSPNNNPVQNVVPLSFNDLPCRAQHLILNELIKSHSQKTAVIFTTLPSPIEGTWRDTVASESYVSDLDLMCNGLPPCLLVHSNSMTVTMNL